ncbi:MAG: hypothetical protein KAJ06_09775, partial [Gammaproteobacteria bacterium]|nr:hypothetical protein [Gammaproteobacteria bacterium]
LLDNAAANSGTDVYDGSNPQKLRASLDDLFSSILTRTSSGSAASVISASTSGEGALYQAIFWPDKDSGVDHPVTGLPIMVKWTGEVHAFLVDSQGVLYMDNCQDDTTGCNTGGLDGPVDTDSIGDPGYGIPDSFLNRDQAVLVYYDSKKQQDTSGLSIKGTKACPGTIVELIDENDYEVVYFDNDGECINTPEPLEDVEYLWSTTDWLNRFEADDAINVNREVDNTTDYKFEFAGNNLANSGLNADTRFIFTWNDLDNDGVADPDEMRDFVNFLPEMGTDDGTATSFPAVDPSNDRGPVPVDFGVDPRAVGANVQVNRIINWMRGDELIGMRNRTVDGEVWKLGDVVHSTPLSVATPAENYHQLYRDFSYADFLGRWRDRRHMIYFGANDGMLHAVNGGFFDDTNNRFCREQNCGSVTDTPELGAEMWAYVPYNLLP